MNKPIFQNGSPVIVNGLKGKVFGVTTTDLGDIYYRVDIEDGLKGHTVYAPEERVLTAVKIGDVVCFPVGEHFETGMVIGINGNLVRIEGHRLYYPIGLVRLIQEVPHGQ
jgi:hypothetical protein